MIDGILNVNKPQGMTSFKVVSLIKRISGEKRVGHAGTLDPEATGVLPVCLGRGTRVIEYLMDTTKAYRAEIEFGVSTDTFDSTGNVTSRIDPSGISRGKLDVALLSFHGLIEQVPPIYSALKYQGRPLYELARSGAKVKLSSRPVTIYKLDIIDWQPPVVTIEVVCSKGTYIRSLANDLGENVGCGAHMKSLNRLRCGIFDIKDAVPLSEIENAFHNDLWQKYVYPMDSVLMNMPFVVVSADEKSEIITGRPIAIKDSSEDINPEIMSRIETGYKNLYRAYTVGGRFVAVLELTSESGLLHPKKVFV
jgi:tRNA pseudouridine55 synthase